MPRKKAARRLQPLPSGSTVQAREHKTERLVEILHGVALAMVLFNPSDIKSGRLYERLAKYDFDTVLWYRPDAAARDVISRLKDQGVRLIALNDHHLSPIHNRYEIRREEAITEFLH